ncbi:MAG: SDR family NAD(P)-dependent oxidoreductase [Candidatus Binataceae bacterium]|jgi:NAD(P)-dependent dehydrogenase (short-subunit alcohol dehydrogenase family)
MADGSVSSELLKGQRALVTGGSKGIGAATAEALALAGADVAIVGRDSAGLAATCDAVARAGRECVAIEADLHSVDGARRAGELALKHSPHWDILVNNAGIAKVAPLLQLGAEDLEATFAVNLRAALILSQLLVPQMIRRSAGKIVNVSSIGAFIGTPGLGAYAASKAALNQLTRTMAVEWGPHNIQVNAVCPTIVLTDMAKRIWDEPSRTKERQAKLARIPLGRFCEPREVADVVVFLASPAANFLTGQSIPLEGGMLAAP